MRLTARRLTTEAFAGFGTVTFAPTATQRAHVGPAVNLRADAATRLDWVEAAATALPFTATVMERHRFSSQSFVPCAADARWLVLVAPHGADRRPDMARACAFLADGQQALTYAPDTWHHPLRALDRPARFALLTHLDGGPDDDLFATLAEPVEVIGGD